jgi:hypothetical protein
MYHQNISKWMLYWSRGCQTVAELSDRNNFELNIFTRYIPSKNWNHYIWIICKLVYKQWPFCRQFSGNYKIIAMKKNALIGIWNIRMLIMTGVVKSQTKWKIVKHFLRIIAAQFKICNSTICRSRVYSAKLLRMMVRNDFKAGYTPRRAHFLWQVLYYASFLTSTFVVEKNGKVKSCSSVWVNKENLVK